MFIAGLIIGIFLGANIGIILAGFLMHAKREEAILMNHHNEDLLKKKLPYLLLTLVEIIGVLSLFIMKAV